MSACVINVLNICDINIYILFLNNQRTLLGRAVEIIFVSCTELYINSEIILHVPSYLLIYIYLVVGEVGEQFEFAWF